MEVTIEPRNYMCENDRWYSCGKILVVTYDDGTRVICHWEGHEHCDMEFNHKELEENFRRLQDEDSSTT